LDGIGEGTKLSIVALLVANLIPLIGVLFFGLDTSLILIIYLAESVLMEIFAIVKAILSGFGLMDEREAKLLAEISDGTIRSLRRNIARVLSVIYSCAFIAFFFELIVFGPTILGLQYKDILKQDIFSILIQRRDEFLIYFFAILISQLSSFWTDFLSKKDYRQILPGWIWLVAGTGRALLLFYAVLIGAIFGAPVLALVVLKTFIDYIAMINARTGIIFSYKKKKEKLTAN